MLHHCETYPARDHEGTETPPRPVPGFTSPDAEADRKDHHQPATDPGKRPGRVGDQYGQWDGLTDTDRLEIAAGWAEEPVSTYADPTGTRTRPKESYLLDPDGTFQPVTPRNGRDFRLEELYEHLRCDRIEVVYLGDSPNILIIDEEGSFPTDRQLNPLACGLWWHYVPEAKGQPLFGRVIACHTTQLR